MSARPPTAKIAPSSTRSRCERLSDPMPVATSQIPTLPEVPGTAIRFESGLKARVARRSPEGVS